MTGNTDQLDLLLRHAGVTGGSLGPDDAERLWALVGSGDDARFDEFLEAITPAGSDDELPLRVGGWRIDLAETAVRTTVLTALVAGVMIPQGMSEFAVGFVTAVLPSVFEIERVEVAPGDQRLLVELRARATHGSEDELYATLPQETRDVINRYDFADFIQRLREAGLATGSGEGPIVLRAPREP